MRLHLGKFTVVFAVLALSSLAMGQETDLDAEIDRVGVEYKSDYGDVSRFGGPISVGAELQAANRKKTPLFRFRWMDELLEPWFEMKKKLHADHGISFGINYNALTQWLTESEGDRFAAGGVFEFFGSWTALWRDTDHRGSLTWKLESRHRLGTDVAPQFLGFEAGIASLTGTKFGDYGFALTNFFWRQEFAGGKFVLQLGRLDATDYLDVYAMENPLAGFQNFVFTLNPTISAPNEGSLGVVAAARATEEIYVIAGFIDANGVPTQTGWDTFFSDHEYFKHVEVGYTPDYERRYLDKINLLFWHQDEREDAGLPAAWGLAFTATTFIDDEWMPFLRVGRSFEDVALLEASVSIGIGHYDPEERDLVGLGLNWGRPSGTKDSQYIGELFYRLQLSQNLQLTPSIQLVVNPANNPDENVIGVFGLRARLTF
jgi:porin